MPESPCRPTVHSSPPLAQVDVDLVSELRAELVSSGGMAAVHHRGRSFLHAAPVSQLARGILSSGPDQAINRSLMSMLLTPAEAAALLPPQDDEEMSLLTRQDEEVITFMQGFGIAPTALGICVALPIHTCIRFRHSGACRALSPRPPFLTKPQAPGPKRPCPQSPLPLGRMSPYMEFDGYAGGGCGLGRGEGGEGQGGGIARSFTVEPAGSEQVCMYVAETRLEHRCGKWAY